MDVGMVGTFRCAQCGRCCSGLIKPASPEVRETLNKSLGRSGFYFIPSTRYMAPWLLEWEVDELTEEATRLGVKFPVRPNQVYVDMQFSQPLVMGWAMDFRECPFHREGRCSVHGRHPLVCRQYPFLNVNTISNGCPQAPPIPRNLNGEDRERWLINTYTDTYRNALHFHFVLRHNYGMIAFLTRQGILRPAPGLSLSAVNRLVKLEGAVGLFGYLLKNGLISGSEYSMRINKLRTLDGAVELTGLLEKAHS